MDTHRQLGATRMKDSGLSDSQFMRFQDAMQKKMKNYVDDFNEGVRFRSLKKRFEESKNRKRSFWEGIKNIFWR